ncbi:proton channel OtopLc-like isoform X2 [Uloborus diversus]|uniref:proton channel OtopLc-like isoform X2 n=1 Tax=Uloborus diversus TaxID=327109 RepID=UPI00240A2A59|nr:proton channel OtopLc-like isoform X2 [Uloborus diversus]
MALIRNFSGRKFSETDSITSSMMSFGDDMEVPKFIFTAEDGVNRLIVLEEEDTQTCKSESRRSDSDPTSFEYPNLPMRSVDLTSTPSITNDSGLGNSSTLKVGSLPMTQPEDDTISLSRESVSSAPPSTHDAGFMNSNSNRLNNLLVIPPSGPFINLSPRPLRRALSARYINENHTGSLHRVRKPTGGQANSLPPEYYGDSISVINVPASQTDAPKRKTENSNSLSVLMSGIYAVFLVMLGAIIFLNDQHRDQRVISEVFSSVIAAVGLLWLIIFHFDLCMYKREVLKQLKETEDAMQENSDRFSTATEFIINSGYDYTAVRNVSDGKKIRPPPYRFLMGRHSGSFYLKIGSAAFCFGYLIYQVLQLGQHILNYVDVEKKQLNCQKPTSIILHVISPIHAFYQLFMTFKYSNIVINRHRILARFGIMHLIATCLCNWFGTIVEEAVEDYTHKSNNNFTDNITSMEFDIASFHIIVQRKENWDNPYFCSAESVLSTRSLSAIPYLYPFAIEYNLLLAGVWFIVWQNIGKEHMNANPHHLRHTISQDEYTGSDEIAYQSNLVINADCHSANKGLFIGLFLLLTIIVTVIIFFVSMTTDGYQQKAIDIHTAQEGVLTVIGLLSVCISFYQIRKLDISEHPITFLDDVLLFVPLPFYFVHGIMSVTAEFANSNYTRLALHILVTFQVVVQTPFILDGLRRCSNSQTHRYRKPGREVITFLIILNLTLWVVNTFELKSVEHYHGQEEYFGDLIWMFVGHTTLPLMLFYRFHSSVCLADMWKSAYEKEA